MKKIIFLIAITFLGAPVSPAHGILDKIKIKSTARADNKVDNAIDKGLDKVEDEGKGNNNKADNSNNTNDQKQSANSSSAPSLKVYQNYDFVPGDKILFEDNFVGDQDGEFPAHWELKAGQAILNKVPTGEEALFLTDGNYVVVSPRMKTQNYLTDPFTIEYDFFAQTEGSYGLVTGFKSKNEDAEIMQLSISTSEAEFGGFSKGSAGTDWTENFRNKWHHTAIAVKNHQMKIYIDQNRILVVPDTHADFVSVVFEVRFEGGFTLDHPIIFKNVRI